MSSLPCPRCGAPASGNFCSSCGASLVAVTCPSCGSTPAPGARFCNKCGVSLTPETAAAGGGAPAAGGDSRIAWWIAGGTLVALIVLAAWPVIHPGSTPTSPVAGAAPASAQGAPVAPFAGGAGGTGTPPDLSKMTPREAADRLYDRVMTAVEGSDEATVQRFMPMALAAYDMAKPLDADGMYHLATLQRANADFKASLSTAEAGLKANADHLLLVAAQAEGTEALGDMANAKKLWQHFLDIFDKQRSLGLEEYGAHEGVLDASRTHAREVVGR